MRLFFAIELPGEVRERIAHLQSELRPRLRSARWVAPANIHLTLRFLGETSADTAKRIGARLEGELASRKSFPLEFCGLGAFPSTGRPRVLWVGTLDAPSELFELQTFVEEAARMAGLPPETRSFGPHLTIARFRRPERGLARVLSSMGEPSFGGMTVSELVCFESRLSPAGASYHPLGRFEIGRTAGII